MRFRNVQLWMGTLALVSSPSLCGQVRYKIPEPKIVREWSLDEQGLRQWKKLDQTCSYCRGRKVHECEFCKDNKRLQTCPICKNKRTITCRVCGGTGKAFDPLVELICPFCQGLRWYPCGLCNGRGSYPVEGGGKKEQKCPGCRAKGVFKCSACRGTGHIAVAHVGRKGPGEASVADLKKARATLQKTLKALEAFPITANESKTFKAFQKIVKRSTRVLPVLKPMAALLQTSLKALRKGSSYTGYPEWVLTQFAFFQDKTIYLLRHQILLLNLCLERAEFNEKVIAANKDK